MNHVSRSKPPGAGNGEGRSRLPIWIAAGVVAVLLLAWLGSRRPSSPAPGDATGRTVAESEGGSSAVPGGGPGRDVSRLLRSRSGSGESDPPEVIVADKAAAFARSRRSVVDAMAQRFQVQVPEDVQKFFAAAEAGRWDEIKGLFNTLSAERESGRGGRDLDVLWPAIKESYSVAEAAASWPAGELLEYGQSILGSLRPGMVYVAGSDSARSIPALLGETGGGERPIILPQNGLGEGNQLDYLSFLHGDRMAALSRDDVQGVFAAYMEEARQRASQTAADASNPAEARPAESDLFKGNQGVISGPQAVVGMNEKLISLLMEKNPGMTFALEQSVPMTSLYSQAVPLGPMLEVRGSAAPDGLVAAQAGDSVTYWQSTAQRLEADASLPPDAPSRISYARMAATQADYFAARNLPQEAERTYRLALEMAPASIEAAGHLSRFLVNSGRKDEAMRILDDFGRQHADQTYMVEEFRKSIAAPAAPPAETEQP